LAAARSHPLPQAAAASIGRRSGLRSDVAGERAPAPIPHRHCRRSPESQLIYRPSDSSLVIVTFPSQPSLLILSA
jgi:hypothetical protein